jgi:hypothetical protein
MGLLEVRAILQLIQLELEVHVRRCPLGNHPELVKKLYDRVERANFLIQMELDQKSLKLLPGTPPVSETKSGKNGESNDSGEGVSV